MKIVYTILLALACQLTLAQSNFITRWNLSTTGSGATRLSFGVATSGPVSYTWTEVSPGTATGSGVFNGSPAIITGLPAGATIDLSISPANFQRFFIQNGADKNRLVDVRQWGTTAWSSMESAFYGCANLQVSATDVPDLSIVTEMGLMFRDCAVLNGPVNIGTWNTGNVTGMFGTFNGALAFNQPIGNWNTQNVKIMYTMFLSAKAFNQPIGDWNTQNVKNMASMFSGAMVFNQPIGNWNTKNVTDMSFMFGNAIAFDQPLDNWTLVSVDLTSIFSGSALSCFNYSQTLKGWSANPNTGTGRFLDAQTRTYSPGAAAARNNLLSNKGWSIYGDAPSGTECLGSLSYFSTQWDLTKATGSGSTQLSFDVATSGSVNYTWKEVSPGTATGSGTFSGPTATITGLPAGAILQLQISPVNFERIQINNGVDKDRLVNVNQWGTTVWTSMREAFYGCTNLQISATDVPDLSLVADMASMFKGCAVLYGPANINNWNLQNVANMNSMFNGASAFDQNISSWNTQNVTDMSSMFNGATVFDQSLGNWTLNASVNLSSIFDDSGLSCFSYSETLKGWNANSNTPNGLSLAANGKSYSPGATAARDNLINSKGWTITSDTQSGTECSVPLSVTQFVTRWNLATAGSGATQLSFAVTTSGSVGYTWAEIYPGAATGSGTFTGPAATLTGLPAGATIELRIAPAHFEGFAINNNADKNRLIDVVQWGSTSWNSMNSAFYGCAKLQISAGDVPDLSEVTDMSSMFSGCTILNSPFNINNWNTENVTDMTGLLRSAGAFNQPIGNWNTTNVTSFYRMFNDASFFNQNIGNWDTQNAENLSEMFFGASAFNQNIGGWNTENVTNMNGMFRKASAFNRAIGTWKTGKVNNMAFLFRDAIVFNQPIANWNTQAVTDMNGAFQNASAFNQPLATWNTQNVTSMNGMFQNASTFNQPLATWNTQNVTSMKGMFQNAGAFNSPIGDWNTQSVADMTSMFQNAGNFNQSVGGWTLNASVNLTSIFTNSGLACNSYSQTLIGWGTNAATPSGRNLEVNGRKYNPGAIAARNDLITIKGWTITGDIAVETDCITPTGPTQFVTRWDLSTAGSGTNQLSFGVATSGSVGYSWTEISPGTATGSGTFSGNTATITGLPTGATIELRISPTNFRMFRINNGADKNRLVDVSQWGSTLWSEMTYAFASCKNLQISATDIPNLSQVTYLAGMFRDCGILNGPANIGSWNVQNVVDMSYMFYGATAFNQPIANWNTHNVQVMTGMFREAATFNQPIGNWNTQNVLLMDQMFSNASAFNQPIGNWNTASVTEMRSMFASALAFNQPIGSWNTQNVVSMNSMFRDAVAFNQPIDGWNVQIVANLNFMFAGASAFDRSLGNWTLNASEGLASIFRDSGLSCYNYSETLKGWSANTSTPGPRTFDATGRTYSPSAVAARNNLTANKGWTITGDNASTTECLMPLSSDQFITRWNLSTTGSGSNQLSFGVTTTGSVSYVWTEISPGTATGSGTFSGSIATITDLPTEATIELRILPANFQTITINNGADKDRLFDVRQWGSTSWSSMRSSFYGCSNLQISATDVPDLSLVYDLSEMFRGCTVLNGPANIGSWNIQTVYFWDKMFEDASAFNQPVGNWNTQSGVMMNSMFFNATAFNQSLGNWTLGLDVELGAIFTNSGLDCHNYSETLKGWSANPATPDYLYLDATGRTYSPSAESARTNLTTNKHWTIQSDSEGATECSGSLPVKLASFSGQKNNENQNVLKWTTTDERNFDRFEIQRSSDAIHFQTIGTEWGQKRNYSQPDLFTQSRGLNTYAFTDQTPGFFNYYRLRIDDIDGSFEYSGIIAIGDGTTKSVVSSLYPNPSNGPVFVDVYDPAGGKWTVTIVDAAGKISSERTYDLQKGENTLQLEHFVPGLNLVRFEYGGYLYVRKLIRN